MKEIWKLYGKKADFEDISRRYGINRVTARIMVNRGVRTDEEIDSYLNRGTDSLASAALLKDGDKAAELIKTAIEQNQLIAISSDFDNDGIFSGLLLKEAIIGLGGRAEIFTPNRITEGYGMNSRIVEEAAEKGAGMILTCDNGIAAFEAVDRAKSLGMTVIITDHHEVPYEDREEGRVFMLPKADAIVDPKQENCRYPFKGLCGTGVVFRLMEYLYRKMGKEMLQRDVFLQYTAIATVADVMDLSGENRIIVKEGLEKLRNTDHIGLLALMEVCGIEPDAVRAYHIGFILGPCFNAAGRLDTVLGAFSLLEEKDREQALVYAQALADRNNERKELTQKGVDAAVDIIENAPWKDEPVYLVYIPDCHESVAGIIAGRIRERYYRPVLVFTDAMEEGLIKASGRSVEAYNMFENLNEYRGMFERFGGHSMAAGLTMKRDRLDRLRELLNTGCTLTEQELTPVIMIDVPMPLGYITEEVIADLDRLEPFGKGNEKPLFAQQHLRVLRISRIGKNRNMIRMSVMGPEQVVMDALYFGDADQFSDFIEENFGKDNLAAALRGMPNTIDIGVTYYPQVNVYQNRRSLQIVVQNYCRISTK